MGLKCASFSLALHRGCSAVHTWEPGFIKPCWGFMAALPFNVCLRHNEGAEIPFYGTVLQLFCPCLTPSDRAPHPISPYHPDSYFCHLFPFCLFSSLNMFLKSLEQNEVIANRKSKGIMTSLLCLPVGQIPSPFSNAHDTASQWIKMLHQTRAEKCILPKNVQRYYFTMSYARNTLTG